ncbi:MAG: response regulator transcription factor, partial [Burkholderiaceae bacterium]|nr:response regulator transcription factor [Burkholderiaceae bacterium]
MNEFNKAQLLVVDDHPIVRHGIVQLLNRQPDMEVVAEADDAETALNHLRERSFNLIVTDISLPGLSGLDLIRRINATKDAPPMLVLSMHEESVYAERALTAGARGFVMKQEAPDKLVAAVRKLLAGGIYLSAQMEERMLMTLVRGKPATAEPSLSVLTEREFEVLQMIAQGLTSAQIAERINRSIKSVEAYRTSLRTKLGAKTTVDLARLALEHFPHVPRSSTPR